MSGEEKLKQMPGPVKRFDAKGRCASCGVHFTELHKVNCAPPSQERTRRP